MLVDLPGYIVITFLLSTLFTVGCLVYAFQQQAKLGRTWVGLLTVIVLWMAVQAILALNQVYQVTSLPPRLPLFAMLPPLLGIIILLARPAARQQVMHLSLWTLTLLHVVRIPVELVLWWLYQQGEVPQLMTFVGRNFDILAGLTAPLVLLWGWQAGRPKRNLLLGWNIISIGLLLNIVIPATLSMPYPIQQFAFAQPNRALFYFPFIWLPSVVVPLVLFSHLAAIVQLVKQGNPIAQRATSAEQTI